jgi:hypothetical protein
MQDFYYDLKCGYGAAEYNLVQAGMIEMIFGHTAGKYHDGENAWTDGRWTLTERGRRASMATLERIMLRDPPLEIAVADMELEADADNCGGCEPDDELLVEHMRIFDHLKKRVERIAATEKCDEHHELTDLGITQRCKIGVNRTRVERMLRCEHSFDSLGCLGHNPRSNLVWVEATRLRSSRRPQRARNLGFLFLRRPFGLAWCPAWLGGLCTWAADGKILKALSALHRCVEGRGRAIQPRPETGAKPGPSRPHTSLYVLCARLKLD